MPNNSAKNIKPLLIKNELPLDAHKLGIIRLALNLGKHGLYEYHIWIFGGSTFLLE